MKKITLIAVLIAAAFSATPTIADNKSVPLDKGVQTQQNTPNVVEFDKQMQKAQENMKLMQDQMDKINKTQNPEERQKLLQEHWATMHNGMGMMHGMWGSGMMGGNMMSGHMMGWKGMGSYYSKLTPEQMRQRQYMMDRYMGMQQQMMDHMMQHQHYMWMQPPK
jgi:hypothetical protein